MFNHSKKKKHEKLQIIVLTNLLYECGKLFIVQFIISDYPNYNKAILKIKNLIHDSSIIFFLHIKQNILCLFYFVYVKFCVDPVNRKIVLFKLLI